jgi:hypothetical protein
MPSKELLSLFNDPSKVLRAFFPLFVNFYLFSFSFLSTFPIFLFVQLHYVLLNQILLICVVPLIYMKKRIASNQLYYIFVEPWLFQFKTSRSSSFIH